jgi:GntR family transcriptional regulator
VKEVVGKLAINPNTVLKAYRELEHEGLVTSKPGVGTFIARSLANSALDHHPRLRAKLADWLMQARSAGLDQESILALFASEMRGIFEGATA